MFTFTGSRNTYGTLTNNASTTNLTFGDIMINEGIKLVLSDMPWPFMEKVATETTVASQQAYRLPGDLSKLINVYVLVGTFKYTPVQVTSFDDWNQINNPTGVTSDATSHFFIVGNEINFWPIPANNSNTITFEYVPIVKDLSVADYTTGTITTATNGSRSITGSGTSWTAGMAGRWIRITAGSAANLGDGLWYQIASIDSSTTMTLVREYSGTSIAVGTANYTMGDCSLIPEPYQIAPIYYAVAEYWRKNGDDGKADRFEAKFDATLESMRKDEGRKTSDTVLDNGSDNYMVNPNLNKSSTSS